MPGLLPLLRFAAPVPASEHAAAASVPHAPRSSAAATAPSFGQEPELPPTWSENSRIFHTTAKCTRLQAIRPNRRISGKPGLREHCLNCIDITATKRRG